MSPSGGKDTIAPAGFLVKDGRSLTIGGKEIPVGGDIILSVEDVPVVSEENIERIRNKLAGTAPGATFEMAVLRAGKVIELTGTSR